jgi:hypothetical protein
MRMPTFLLAACASSETNSEQQAYGHETLNLIPRGDNDTVSLSIDIAGDCPATERGAAPPAASGSVVAEDGPVYTRPAS